MINQDSEIREAYSNSLTVLDKQLYYKIQSIKEYLELKIDTVKSEQAHYATKYFMLVSAGIVSASVAGAYAYITPLMIEKEKNALDNKVDKILESLTEKNTN